MATTTTNNTRQAAWIAVASMFSFGFTIVSSMILSRYFDKADYGTYRQVLYVYHTLLMVFTLGLPKAFSYFLPRVERSQAKSLIRKISNLFFILGGVFSVLLFVGAPLIAEWMKNPDLAYGLRLFAVVPVLMLPTMGLEGILATYRKTLFMTIYTIVTRIVMLLCVAGPVVLWHGSYIDAIIGFDIASVVAFVLALYFKYYPVRNEANEVCEVSYREIFSFSLPLLFATLWGVVIQSADQFFVSRYFGTEVFAEFTNGFMELPFVGMILGSCAAVLSPIYSRMSHEKIDPRKEVYPIWMSVFRKTAMLTYPLIIYCWFFAKEIMIFLYGEQYDVSYIYFRIKLFTYIFSLIVYGPLLINIGKVKFYSNVHAWVAVIVIILELISVYTMKSPYAISVISLMCQIGKAIALLWASASYLGVRIHQLFPFRLILQILLPSALFLSVEHWLMMWMFTSMNVVFLLCMSAAIYAIVYYIYSLIVKIDYIGIIKPLLKK